MLVFNAEAVDFSSVDWVPTIAPTTRALRCLSAGTVYVDFVGSNLIAGAGAVNFPITFATGETIEIAATKIHHTSSSGSFQAWY